MSSTLHYLLLGLTLAGVPLLAEADSASQGSALSVEGSTIMVEGSATVFEGAKELVVDGVEASAEGTVILVKNSVTGATASVLAVGDVAGASALVAGSTVEVVAEGSGWALTQAGKLIAFVPNKVGEALLHHNKH
ncbi:MAG: hypothetical protein LRY38_06170 [Aeromonadaceae bacterium]|nr:hypothetical protein [Aeromonadaceae bacterium]